MGISKATIGADGKRRFLFKTELATTSTSKYSLRSFEKFMAVKIRMKRVGAKNAPFFRIVVADSRSHAMASSSRNLARIGR